MTEVPEHLLKRAQASKDKAMGLTAKSERKDFLLTSDNIDKLLEAVEKEAAKKAYNAGMGGYYDDGGASELRRQANFWKAGLARSIPREWDQIVEKLIAELDPDWAEYQRLKEKFK